MSVVASPVREFVFIRHGESESNADLATDHPHTIRLTAKGEQQAHAAAQVCALAPDIFITSKYLRTKQTAAPFMAKFPAVTHEEWDIHEFTFLDPDKYKNTTFTQRRPFSLAYWEKADLHHRDNDRAESFASFAQRCTNTIARMKTSTHSRSIVFSHGFFIKGLMFAIDGHFDTLAPATMTHFLDFHLSTPLDNCAIVHFHVTGNDVRYTVQTNAAAAKTTRTD